MSSIGRLNNRWHCWRRVVLSWRCSPKVVRQARHASVSVSMPKLNGRWEPVMVDSIALIDPNGALIKDSAERVKKQLAQVPEGKTGALVVAVDWKYGVVPTLRTGIAHRTANGWEIHGEGFISKAEKGVSVRAVK